MKSNIWKIMIVVVLVAVVGIVLATKNRPAEPEGHATTAQAQAASGQTTSPAETVGSSLESVTPAAGQSQSGPSAAPAASPEKSGQPIVPPVEPVSPPVPAAAPATAKKLPKLLDLGAKKCIPCKMMAPLLEELAKDYKGRMDVEFIDVWKDPDAGKAYGISIIPTQIFYGPDGKELARHQGFMDRAAILTQWKAVGVNL